MTTRVFRWVTFVTAALTAIGSAGAGAQQPARREALAGMPVKEVSVFKDGHAFVLHEGSLPVDTAGQIVMDYLPAPVLGTFWAYAVDRSIAVKSVTASRRPMPVEQPARRLADLLEANVGAAVTVTEKPTGSAGGVTYAATILAFPGAGAGSPQNATGTPVASPVSSDEGLILLQLSDGVKALPIGRIQDVTFKAAPKPTVIRQQPRDALTLSLDWKTAAPRPSADIGLAYLQKGLRWIPTYRVDIDGKGTANTSLQAVVVNELADLAGVTMNLVVGVPSFAFENTLDPLALRTSNPLSSYFQREARPGVGTATMTQVGPRDSAPAPDPSLAALAGGQNNSEDLFLFTLRDITLGNGERLSVPVIDQRLSYTDLYTLDLPFVPPPEIRSNVPGDQGEVARLMAASIPSHKIRLRNATSTPLTTGPALVVQGDRVLSQAMMTYTSAGGTTDLEIGKAVDIRVVRTEAETARSLNAVRAPGGEALAQVQMTGSIGLTNHRRDAVAMEVTRDILGVPGTAGNGGQVERLSAISEYPAWWRNYNWPFWSSQMNGVGRFTWHVTIAPGQTVELTYNWSYYWR